MVANLTIPPNNVNGTFPDARGALLRARKAKAKYPDEYQQAIEEWLASHDQRGLDALVHAWLTDPAFTNVDLEYWFNAHCKLLRFGWPPGQIYPIYSLLYEDFRNAPPGSQALAYSNWQRTAPLMIVMTHVIAERQRREARAGKRGFIRPRRLSRFERAFFEEMKE